jgi:hypothetical protein
MAPTNLPAAARQAVFRSMLKNMLLEEVPAPTEHRDIAWRQDDDGAWVALRITADRAARYRCRAGGTERHRHRARELTGEDEAAELKLQQEAMDAAFGQRVTAWWMATQSRSADFGVEKSP